MIYHGDLPRGRRRSYRYSRAIVEALVFAAAWTFVRLVEVIDRAITEVEL